MKTEQVVYVWTVKADSNGETHHRYLGVTDVDVKEGVLAIQKDNPAGNGFLQMCIPLWNVKSFDVEVMTDE